MDEKTAKERIRQLLILQQEIAFAGGTYQHSAQCRHFARKLRLIFASFGQEVCYENITSVFNFPFTYSLNVVDHCSADLCPHSARMFYSGALLGIKADIKRAEKQGMQVISVEQRAEWIYDALISLQTFGIPEID